MAPISRKRLFEKLPWLAVFFIVAIAAVAMTVLYWTEMMQVDKNIVKNGNLLLNSYISDTKDSIEKGQRKTFQIAMNKIAKIKDVKSVSLYTKDRLMVYKSFEVTIGKPFIKKNGKFFNPNLELYRKSKGMYLRDDWSLRSHRLVDHAQKYTASGNQCNACHYQLDPKIVFDSHRRGYEIDGDDSSFYYDIPVEQECISCHTYWKDGESAGYLSISMDNRDIISQVKGNIANFIIVLCVVILLFLAIGYYIQKLNKRIKAQAKEVVKINQKINNLLNNAGQGFLSFGSDFFINSEYSKECTALLEEDLEGKDISKLLFADDLKKYVLFKDSISSMLQAQDSIVKRAIATLLPETITLHKKVLKLEYKLLENDTVMLILTNITLQRKLENRIKKEQEDLKMIIAVVSDSENFFELKSSYEKFSKEKLELIDTDATFLENVTLFFRIIHTFKGSFSQFFMHNCVNELHQFENRLSELLEKRNTDGYDIRQLLSEIDFISFPERDLDSLRKILGKEFMDSGDTVKVKKQYLWDLENTLQEMMKKDAPTPSDYRMLHENIEKLISKKLIDALKVYPKLSMQIATRLNKKIYPFSIIGDESVLMEERLSPFVKSLIHLFRNAVDHGIETPERRCQLGKEEEGTLGCAFEVHDHELQIVISDDGAGIDPQRLKQSALEKGVKTESEIKQLSEQDLYQMIFLDQLSTKEQISTISGRGVGLGAVKTELDKVGGSVKIETKKDKGTKFIFNIPLKAKELL